MNTHNHKHTNRLIHESSPYLLQHAHNPVNWYPWGKEALDKAQKENKLIIISIGYAACHWCHVMEHESFENEDVAAYMNEHFVAIKVDREERPDIDQVYMSAVQLITGSGGWPLNCIALPDGRPFFGGTYFPKDQWLAMLSQVVDFVNKNPEKAQQQAQSLTQGVQSSERIYAATEKEEYTIHDLDTIFASQVNSLDYVRGGQQGAPKFPMPAVYQFLLYYSYLTKNDDALKAVTTTLHKMADGGIYDQIGGGFSRYSTDAYWKVPHFEKMLYDNAQLVSLYAAAYQHTREQKFKIIVTETLDFIQRELTSKEGGFYSSLDADSENEEGKFYVWTQPALQELLGNNTEVIMDYYSVTENGNWENLNNILFKTKTDQQIATTHNITIKQLSSIVAETKSLLLKERSKRHRPGRDDKILTSWNALMLKGYCDAYQVFNDERYLASALKIARFIRSKLQSSDNSLRRNYKNGTASINAFLDDYAFTIHAFIALYNVTFDEQWLQEAQRLTSYTLEHFWDTTSGMFYYTSDLDPALIARKMELSDNVIPSSNSAMAINLYLLGHYFYNDGYINTAKGMLNNVRQPSLKNGTFFANWNILSAWLAGKPFEVAIIGNDCHVKRKELSEFYLPNCILSGGTHEGSLPVLKGKLLKEQTTIYVCRNRTCKLPVTNVNDAVHQINNHTGN